MYTICNRHLLSRYIEDFYLVNGDSSKIRKDDSEMARVKIEHAQFKELLAKGLDRERIATLYNITLTTLRNYERDWKYQREIALERQYFLTEMRKASGVSQADLAFQLGIRLSELLWFETNEAGLIMGDEEWSKFENNLRLTVSDEINYRRQKRVYKAVN